MSRSTAACVMRHASACVMRHTWRRLVILVAVGGSTLGSCRVGPRYHRPPLDVPTTFRGERQDTTGPPSFGEAKWWNVFRDDELQKLIRQALDRNYDVRIAAARVLQARAQLTITRADQFPTVSVNAEAQREQIPSRKQGGFELGAATVNLFQLDALLSWELDFWGRFRSATDRERANLLGTRWGARAVVVSVVSQVARSYFTLRELDLELSIARRTLAARQESLDLTRTQERGGVASLIDVREAEQLVYTAASVITDTERLIAQQENAIRVLLGENPGSILRGLPLVDQPEPPAIPAGMPSRLLERRPDIRQAEQSLIAANADIGVARAALFPEITLTTDAGFASNMLSQLFTTPSELLTVAIKATQYVFDAGKRQATVRLTEAQKLELVYTYQKTVVQAFREVSDALVGHQKALIFRRQLADVVTATGDAARLSDVRYRGGVASFLEVLTSQTNFFEAELALARARLQELLSLVQLYAALGGGWDP
ncbi:MAG TPA: efflux transporter outer membrane subunit [Gemmatimonadaceae bacterium]|nr:efflux transporter outer membrane subunit [Gemmatimonadaceae bacterium]